MDAGKLISALNGMIITSDNEPKIGGWVKEFLIEVKSTLEEQQEENKRLKSQLTELICAIYEHTNEGTALMEIAEKINEID